MDAHLLPPTDPPHGFDLVAFIQKEWRVIKTWSFWIAVVLAGVALFFIIRWHYSGVIAAKDASNSLLQQQRDKAAQDRDGIQKELDKLKSDRTEKAPPNVASLGPIEPSAVLSVSIISATTFRTNVQQTNMNVCVLAKIENLGNHNLDGWTLNIWMPDGIMKGGRLEQDVSDTFVLDMPGTGSAKSFPFTKSLIYIGNGKVKYSPDGYLNFNTDLPAVGSAMSFALTYVTISCRDENNYTYFSSKAQLSKLLK